MPEVLASLQGIADAIQAWIEDAPRRRRLHFKRMQQGAQTRARRRDNKLARALHQKERRRA